MSDHTDDLAMDPNGTEDDAKTRKTVGDVMRPIAFTFAPGAKWEEECLVAAMPVAWRKALQEAWRRQPGVREGSYLPTRSLAPTMIAVEPATIHVSGNINDEAFIVGFEEMDSEVLAAGAAGWATAEITNEIDWFEVFSGKDLTFEKRTFNLLECRDRPNGTAAPAKHVYRLLPFFVARQVVKDGLDLVGKPHKFILGPPQRDGRRSAVIWPPHKIEDDKAGSGLVTAKITFHIETAPNDGQVQLHADASISRFPLMPVTYVPSRGDGPPGATIWLHAPEGFLRRREPHTLLAASVKHMRQRDGSRRWQWQPGVAHALAKLTHLPFPSPVKAFASPGAVADEGAIRAYILYSEGTKSQAADIDDAAKAEDEAKAPRAKSLLHAANTGLVPGDHIDAHRRLETLLAAKGIVRVEDLPRVGSKAARKIKIAFVDTEPYTIELWTQSALTRDAVLAALEHRFELKRSEDLTTPGVIWFTGDRTIKVVLRNGAEVSGGIMPDPTGQKTDTVVRGLHTNRLVRQLGTSTERIAAIVELEDDKYFNRVRLIDPKPALKKAFARTNRRLQCLRPAKLFTPPKSWPENSKKKKPEPYPGTAYSVGTILRASAAVEDCLRQLGRIGSFAMPSDMSDLEQIGIWLHHDGKSCIPIVIRLKHDGTANAYLAGDQGKISHSVPYADLPGLLANGKGRIGPGPKQKQTLSQFLTNALGVGETIGADTHNRLVVVRAAGFRNWGWDWLQDKHLQPDHLILPGVEIDDDQTTPLVLVPTQTHGLRIARVRDRSSTMEVARGFTHDPEKHHVRISGLFKRSERLYYSINPKSDQMQTPNSRTKFDPDVLGNYTTQASNPVPLEICVAYMQPGDSPESIANLVSQLRRVHSHTEQATAFPGVLHLCELADEYI